MKRTCWLLILLVLFLSPRQLRGQVAADSVYERHWQAGYQKIRIISYNIFNGFDWGKDPDRRARMVAWVRSQDPEILALQELCGFTQQSLEELAREWGHPYAAIVKEGGYPVGITSKRPIRIKAKVLENTGHGLLHVESYGLDLLVTHLNPASTDRRRAEAHTIADYITAQGLEKCILMGDMNAHSPFDADYMQEHSGELLLKYGGTGSPNLLDGRFDYSVVATFLSVPLVDVFPYYVAPERRRSFPTPILMYLSKNPEVLARIGERIDYMLISPSLRTSVADAFIYNEGSADYLSDHFPVGIDLCVKIGTESK